MTFSISIFLYIFWVFLALWFVFFVIAIYHMLNFGAKNFLTVSTTIIFVGIAIIILMTSSFYINQIDWNTNVEILEGLFDNQVPFQ